MQQVDTIIHPRWVIPVESNAQEPSDQTLDRHAIIIDRGRIEAIVPSDEARQQYQSDDVVELVNHALIPGLINSHTHVARSEEHTSELQSH